MRRPRINDLHGEGAQRAPRATRGGLGFAQTGTASAGFTLLEVMVSLAILGLALTAIAGIQANSFEASNYARHVTVATLLARSKMIDMEMLLQKDGFSESDKEESGDFSEEGYESLKWVATVRKVEVDIGQLVGGLFGGDVSAENLPDQMQMFMAGMNGEAPDDLVNEKVGGSELAEMMKGGSLELIFKQVGDTLSDSIREITVEIKWGRKDIDEESVKFVQYVTTTGRLSVPPAGFGSSAGALTPGGRGSGSVVPPTLPGGIPNPAFNRIAPGTTPGGKP